MSDWETGDLAQCAFRGPWRLLGPCEPKPEFPGPRYFQILEVTDIARSPCPRCGTALGLSGFSDIGDRPFFDSCLFRRITGGEQIEAETRIRQGEPQDV